MYINSGCDIELIGNTVHTNTWGIRSGFGCLVKGYGNVIENNTNYGLYSRGSGNVIHFGSPYDWAGNNTIRNNNGYGNVHKYAGASDFYLYNASVHTPSGYELYSNQATSIVAIECWFGGGAPVFGGSGGVIYFEDLLAEPSWEGVTQNDFTNLSKITTPDDDLPDKFRGYDGVIALKAKLQNESLSNNEKEEALRDLVGMLRDRKSVV